MRDYKHIDRYITQLYGDIYPQPVDDGHTGLAQRVVDDWGSKLTACQTVLDAGCGEGFCQPMFERWNMEYTGIALGDDVIVAQKAGRNVKRMDFTFLDFEDESFDLIFSRHSLEHSPAPLLTLMEWNRVSKNWLGIVLPAVEWYGVKGRNHYSVMTLDQAKVALDRAGWYLIWEHVDSLPARDPANPIPHEYWLMCEKKR